MGSKHLGDTMLSKRQFTQICHDPGLLRFQGVNSQRHIRPGIRTAAFSMVSSES